MFGSGPNAIRESVTGITVAGAGAGAGAGEVTGGRLEERKGEGETGIEARGGLGGLAGSTDCTLPLMRSSISSMSDWEEGWRGIVSPRDMVGSGSGGRNRDEASPWVVLEEDWGRRGAGNGT